MPRKRPIEAIDAIKLEAIRQHIAYRTWEEEGRPDGRSEVHWLAACDVVDAMIANTAELPDWLKRIEQTAGASTQQATAMEAGEAARPEPATRFQDVARRFARGT
jgi:hypothetical protein